MHIPFPFHPSNVNASHISRTSFKKGGIELYNRLFCITVKMDQNNPDNSYLEIFADSDSDNEEEFEYFLPDDITNDNNQYEENFDSREYLFDSDKWDVGGRDNSHGPIKFTETPGRNYDVDENATVLDYFELFFDKDNYEEIAIETNRYAKQYTETHPNLSANSRFRKWKDTNAKEIAQYIALIFTMGLLSQSDVCEYWSTNPVTSTPFFPATMSRDRFLLLTSFLHLANNDQYIARGNPGHDPLFKLGNIYKLLLHRFFVVYTPHQQLSLDEGMIPWKGNLSFRVYSPDKPVKYGVKAYMLSDATNGYVSKLKLYTGKSSSGPSVYGATYDLVMDMLSGFFEKGYSMYCDNYYTSPQLFWDLFQLGVNTTGTVRVNRRGIPQSVKDKTLSNRGDVIVMHNGPLECIKYLDSKPVYFLSSIHGSDLVPTRRTSYNSNEIIKKPEVVVQYNKYMGGVDRSDQMIAYMNSIVKSFKWWKKVFFHVLAVAVLDAYILYKQDHPNSGVTHRLFRRKLVSELISSNPMELVVRPGRPSATPQQLERLCGRHFISKIKPTGKKTNITRLCTVCNEAEKYNTCTDNSAKKRKRAGRETSYECSDCKVSLCIEPCFRLYHTCKEYVTAFRRWKNSVQVVAPEASFEE